MTSGLIWGCGEAVAQEPAAGGGLDAGDDQGQADDQPGGADGGANVHELR
jgi:hypothetical protein